MTNGKDGFQLAGEFLGVLASFDALLAGYGVRAASVAVDGAGEPELVAGGLVGAGHVMLRCRQCHKRWRMFQEVRRQKTLPCSQSRGATWTSIQDQNYCI